MLFSLPIMLAWVLLAPKHREEKKLSIAAACQMSNAQGGKDSDASFISSSAQMRRKVATFPKHTLIPMSKEEGYLNGRMYIMRCFELMMVSLVVCADSVDFIPDKDFPST